MSVNVSSIKNIVGGCFFFTFIPTFTILCVKSEYFSFAFQWLFWEFKLKFDYGNENKRLD